MKVCLKDIIHQQTLSPLCLTCYIEVRNEVVVVLHTSKSNIVFSHTLLTVRHVVPWFRVKGQLETLTLVVVPTDRPNEPDPENMKEVQLRVPWRTGLLCWWSFFDHSLYRLLSLPVKLLGFRSQTAPGLWMLSTCLAEIEKHKGINRFSDFVVETSTFNYMQGNNPLLSLLSLYLQGSRL